MQVVHRRRSEASDREGPDEPRVLATDVDVADTLLSKARGLMFRTDVPERYAMVFEFDRPKTRGLHMFFVPFPIDAIWLVGEEVRAVQRLRPWTGVGRATADRVIELPAGGASGVHPGDVVTVEE